MLYGRIPEIGVLEHANNKKYSVVFELNKCMFLTLVNQILCSVGLCMTFVTYEKLYKKGSKMSSKFQIL